MKLHYSWYGEVGSRKQSVTMNERGMVMRSPRPEEGRTMNYVYQGSLSDGRLGPKIGHRNHNSYTNPNPNNPNPNPIPNPSPRP